MEDPWASGSAWATTSKPAERPSSPISSPPAMAQSPSSRFDVSDPWGTSTAATETPVKQDVQNDWGKGSPRAKTETVETPGWGGGWEAADTAEEDEDEVEGEPSRSPARKPQDSPEWGFSGAAVTDPPALEIQPGLDEDDQAASIPAPESPPAGLSSASPSQDEFTFNQPPAPTLSPPDLGPVTLPASPSFGDDFGGFSSGFGDDPWETKKQDNGWGESSRRSSATSRGRDSDVQADVGTGHGDDGWGGAASRNQNEDTVQRQAGMDEEWEEAQRRIRVTEERAPREKIDKLHTGWKGLVTGLAGDRKLEEMGEEDAREHEGRLRRQEEQIYETLRSLATLPPDINTYPPVLSSLETYERYRYALNKPNTTPETSLLNMPLGRRSRRNENALDNLDNWTSRSRLGEPEAPQPDTNQRTEEAKPKWSFWRKAAPEKPLVTSGGGILEVKPSSPALATSAPMEPRASVSSATSASASAAKVSRPASPALSSLPSAIEVVDPVSATAGAGSPVPAPAPSAVSRFFGRLSRRQTSQNTTGADQGNMEFSADDFSFLDQVESMSTPDQEKAIGDLLAMEGGRTEEIASLESMLKSKPAHLPAPLAPPPTASRSAPSARIPSTAPREMDLLSGLDFDGDSGNAAGPSRPSVSQPSRVAPKPSTDWDDFDFLAGPSTQPTPPVNKAPSAPPKIASPPPLLPSQPAARPYATQHVTPSQPSMQPSIKQSANQADFDDFADFAPQATSNQNNDFDDFGDFGDFSTPPPAAPAPAHAFVTPKPTSQLHAPPPSFSQGHTKRASLDHTLTLNLMNDASASKGKRWPAPPSPLAPSLDPPPKAPNAGAFPFISPPPGGSRSSGGMRGLSDLMDESQQTSTPVMSNSRSSPVPPARIQSPPIAPSAPMQPSRTASPLMPTPNASLSRPPSTAPIQKPIQQQGQSQSQSGLSAQDLSFFDNL